jgi:CRISPR-associated protein (TIGR03986 family)
VDHGHPGATTREDYRRDRRWTVSPERIRHVNPTPSRAARAPYNFVPLPEKALFVDAGLAPFREVPNRGWELDNQALVKPWECQDRFLPGTLSGWIDLELKTLTPLFIRGTVSHSRGPAQPKESRLRPEPYTNLDGRPAIPGSSLRGMVRNLIEILSFSKVQPVSERKPFFRAIARRGTNRIADRYMELVLRDGGAPKGGFLVRDGEGWAISLAADVLRVDHAKLRPLGFEFDQSPNYSPWRKNESLQGKQCWVTHRDGKVVDLKMQEASPGTEWACGVLWLTGAAPPREGHEKGELVLLERSPAELLPIPKPVFARFCDDDQITNWQKKAFPKRKTRTGTPRSEDGQPAEGDAVFFVENNGEIEFLGRARLFRFPYDLSPRDLEPASLREGGTDMAEALFGAVESEGAREAFAGRVSFQDALAADAPPSGWFEDYTVPGALSSPKESCFPHYLVQPAPDQPRDLLTYLEADLGRTEIRGHKLYWHRWDDQLGISQVQWQDPRGRTPYTEKLSEMRRLAGLDRGAPGQDTQCTLIRPVKAGVVFRTRLRFDNLAPVELGALLAVLDLPASCAHKIGMGKPLGFGSIRVEKTWLGLIDRRKRYAGWSNRGEFTVEDASQIASVARSAFEGLVENHALSSKEVILPEETGLRRFWRLDALFRLLTWEGRRSPGDTSNMALQEFRDKKVLPTPRAVYGLSDPQPATNQVTASVTSVRSSAAAAPRLVAPLRGLSVNAPVIGIVLPREKWTKKGKVKFVVKGTAFEGTLHPTSPELADPQPGAEVKLTVKMASANPKQNEFILQT